MREIIERRFKKKDIQFSYDENVRIALNLCENHGHITLSNFAGEANISNFIAARVLIRLVLANVLDIKPRPIEDHYILKKEL